MKTLFRFSVTGAIMSAVSSSLQGVFTLLLGPFVFFNAQKTKYLQMLTSLMRWMGKNKAGFQSSPGAKVIIISSSLCAL